MTLRNYNNTAKPVALAADVNSTATVWGTSSTSGYPTPPFTLGIDRGTADEEMALCTAMDGSSFTVQRGFDTTPNVAHTAGAAIEHVVGAIDYVEANAHVNDLLHHTAIVTSTTRPSSPSVGQQIYETDSHTFLYWNGTQWTTKQFQEVIRTYSADNVNTGGAFADLYSSGSLLATAPTYAFYMIVDYVGHIGNCLEPGTVHLTIESPSGTGIWAPNATGGDTTLISQAGQYVTTVGLGYKLYSAGQMPSYVIRGATLPSGNNVYARLGLRAVIIPAFV